jgi:tetratricopeptide (TPR) repeat protein
MSPTEEKRPKIADLLPTSDILDQVGGVEERLARGRRLGAFGWLGVFLSLLGVGLQIAPVVDNIGVLWDQWEFLLSIGVLALSVSIVLWHRFWVKESKRPFRYTYFVHPFEAVAPVEGADMAWLHHDLSKKLSVRISRLSVLEHGSEDKDPGSDRERSSHIEIKGRYGLRWVPNQGWLVEVVPQVGVGHQGAKLGQAVRLPLGRSSDKEESFLPQEEVESESQTEGEGVPAKTGQHGPLERLATLGKAVGLPLEAPSDAEESGREPPASDQSEPGNGAGKESIAVKIRPDEYEALLERVYFSVATEIYKQIRADVQGKIALLPTSYLRATAYLNEAEDYARSNTLDAYADARGLFSSAVELLDPASRDLPASWIRSYPARFCRWLSKGLKWLRRKISRAWPRLGHHEIATARGELGYVKTVLSEMVLASMSGTKPQSPFDARVVSTRAIERLEDLREDVTGQTPALFLAYTTGGLAEGVVGNAAGGRQYLEKARAMKPSDAEEDAFYLYAAGYVEPTLNRKLRFLRRAVEKNPDFEIAHATFAYVREMLWRTRQVFEETIAQGVCEEYRTVVTLNPGNVSVWANLGYVNWLLAGSGVELNERYRREAERAFEAGRDYKEVRREAVVAELDYGLTRLAAEGGRFSEAYAHYVDAVAAQLSQYGSEQAYAAYFFGYCGEAIKRRFERYKERVEEAAERALARNCVQEERIIKSVLAFVLNDYGQAWSHYYLRSGHVKALTDASNAYEEAARQNPDFLLPHFNRARLKRELAAQATDPADRRKHLLEAEGDLKEALRLEPMWQGGLLEMAAVQIEVAGAIRLTIVALNAEIERKNQEAFEYRRRAMKSGLRVSGADWQPATDLPMGEGGSLRLRSEETIAVLEANGAAPGATPATQSETELLTAGRAESLKRDTDLLEGEVERLEAERDRSLGRAAVLIGTVLPRGGFGPRALGESRRREAGAAASRWATGDSEEGGYAVVERIFSDEFPGPESPSLEAIVDRHAGHIAGLVSGSAKSRYDVDPLYVDALVLWGELLMAASEERFLWSAIELCGHIRDSYRPNDFRVLTTQRDACARLRETVGQIEQDSLAETERGCEVVMRSTALEYLRIDPAHHTWLTWVEYLPPDQQSWAYERALHAQNVTGPTLLWLGEQLESKVNAQMARRAYEQVLKLGDSQSLPSAALRLGNLLRLDEPETAAVMYRRTVDTGDPDTAPVAAIELALWLRTEGKSFEAKEVYDEVMAAGPQAALRLGDLLITRQDFESAERALQKAVDTAQEPAVRAPAAVLLGDLFWHRGNTDDAKDAYRKALDAATDEVPLVATTAIRLGDLLRAEEEFAAAENEYQRAAASGDPTLVPTAQVRLAELLQARGQKQEAENTYRKAIGSDDPAAAAKAAFAIAAQMRELGNEEGARSVFDEVIESGSLAAVNLGDLLQANEDVAGAEYAYRRGSQLDHSHAPEAAIRLGDLLLGRGDYPGAEAAYRQALQSQDTAVVPTANLRLAGLLQERQDQDGAEAAYRAALDTKAPAVVPEAAVRLGDLLVADGRRDEAQAIYTDATSIGPEVALQLGELLATPRSNFVEAERAFKEALDTARDPVVRAKAALYLGYLLQYRADAAGAERAYRTALDTPTSDPSVVALSAIRLGEILSETGRTDRAEETYRKAISAGDPTLVPSAQLRLGAVLEALGKDLDAANAYRDAIGFREPETAPKAAIDLAALLTRQGDPENVRSVYDEVIESGSLAALNIGELLEAKGDLAEAEHAYRRGSQLEHPDAPDAAIRLGDLLRRQKDYSGAEAAYRQAIQSEDQTVMPTAYMHLASTLQERGEQKEAEETYRAALATADPVVAPQAAIDLAGILAARGERDAVTQLYEEVIGFGSHAAVTLGDLLRERGELTWAEQAYRRGAEGRHPYAPDAALHLGELLRQKRDFEAAAEAYRRALSFGDPTVVTQAQTGLAALPSPGRVRRRLKRRAPT